MLSDKESVTNSGGYQERSGTLDPLPEIAGEIIFPFEFSLGINF